MDRYARSRAASRGRLLLVALVGLAAPLARGSSFGGARPSDHRGPN